MQVPDNIETGIRSRLDHNLTNEVPHPRVALVIGVQSYDKDHIGPLFGPHRDAENMARLLTEKGGFFAWGLLDPTYTELVEALERFQEVILSHKKNGGCVAVLYYAGKRLASTVVWPCPLRLFCKA